MANRATKIPVRRNTTTNPRAGQQFATFTRGTGHFHQYAPGPKVKVKQSRKVAVMKSPGNTPDMVAVVKAREAAEQKRLEYMRNQQQAGAPAPAGDAAPEAAPAPIDPRDAIYTQGVAGLLAKLQAQRASAQLDQSRENEDFATTLRRMAEARTKDLDGEDSNANRQGLFYSTVLRDRRGGVEKDYSERETDASVAKRRREEDRTAAIKAMGEITADPNSKLGYTATGAASEELLALYEAALRRALGEI